MVCRRCGTLNADEKEFCRHCGASLHWHLVIGPRVSHDRQGVVGLGVAAVALALTLFVAYVQPFAASAQPGPAVPAAETPTLTSTAAPAASATVEPAAAATQEPAPGASGLANRPSSARLPLPSRPPGGSDVIPTQTAGATGSSSPTPTAKPDAPP